jgi:hypothetical protein
VVLEIRKCSQNGGCMSKGPRSQPKQTLIVKMQKFEQQNYDSKY